MEEDKEGKTEGKAEGKKGERNGERNGERTIWNELSSTRLRQLDCTCMLSCVSKR